MLAFDRVSLDAGEEATVELSLPASDLGYYRPGDGHVVEADSYDLTVGDHTSSVTVDGTYM